MGHFTATDAVTRLGIKGGDPVLLVHTDPYRAGKGWEPGMPSPYKDHYAHTYHFGQSLARHIHKKNDNAGVQAEVLAAIRAEHPDLAELTVEELLAKLRELKDTPEDTLRMALFRLLSSTHDSILGYRGVIGTYDDYGWLTLPDGSKYVSGLPTERQIKQPEYTDSAWDQRLPPAHMFWVKLQTLSDLFLEGQPVTEENKLDVMYRLSGFAHALRIQLFGDTHSLLGRQDIDDAEFAEQRTLLRIISNQLADQIQNRIKNSDEADERGWLNLYGETPYDALRYRLGHSVFISWVGELPGGDIEVVMPSFHSQHVMDLMSSVNGFRLTYRPETSPSEHHCHMAQYTLDGHAPAQLWLVKPEHALTKNPWDRT